MTNLGECRSRDNDNRETGCESFCSHDDGSGQVEGSGRQRGCVGLAVYCWRIFYLFIQMLNKVSLLKPVASFVQYLVDQRKLHDVS